MQPEPSGPVTEATGPNPGKEDRPLPGRVVPGRFASGLVLVVGVVRGVVVGLAWRWWGCDARVGLRRVVGRLPGSRVGARRARGAFGDVGASTHATGGRSRPAAPAVLAPLPRRPLPPLPRQVVARRAAPGPDRPERDGRVAGLWEFDGREGSG